MRWVAVVERIANYLLILAFLYLTSQTLLQWNDKRNIDLIKMELKGELEDGQEELQKQIIRIESTQRDWIVTESNRMDALENKIDRRNQN